MLGVLPLSTLPLSDITLSESVVVSATGLEAVASVGNVGNAFGVRIPVTGMAAAVELGSVVVEGDANIVITVDDLTASALTSGVLVWSVIDTTQNANWTRIDDFDPCSC